MSLNYLYFIQVNCSNNQGHGGQGPGGHGGQGPGGHGGPGSAGHQRRQPEQVNVLAETQSAFV